MTKKELYLALKADLLDITYPTPDALDDIPVTNVAIWRNQPSHPTDYTGGYPAIFVEFLNTTYSESNSKAYQNYNPVLRLHLCAETTDAEVDTLSIFDFSRAVYSAMQFKHYGDFSPMKRRAEDTVFNYESVQDYTQDYTLGLGKDHTADKRPATDASITEIIINSDLTDEIDG